MGDWISNNVVSKKDTPDDTLPMQFWMRPTLEKMIKGMRKLGVFVPRIRARR